ncbi:hypothetical protein SF1_10340 [Sphingobacterium faecium NBRC 15299]|uniref:LutC/YkgG family protein n=1 Tax=Sphingobacterium faecium TaxID=34087 RepID=UPI000D344FD8|nr:LUD domain-containing protein [Sphingobacterium faecium]PTX11185.1 L-lactate dehydrogenase complex protein LldG [Sphingobacterium faecium]GEM63052.1 hypothetical protein SF1_10340 [Sphingobacterium faecium NBRC 15299]
MSSLEELLAAIRQNLPAQKVDYPEIPTYEKQGANLKDKFIVNLGLSGGESYDVGSIDEAKEIMQQKLPDTRVTCSATSEWEGSKSIHDIAHPRELEDVDLGIIRAEFGVAEMGMIWLTENSLQVNSLGFLSQHLAILLDPDLITENMHTAYRKIDFQASTYGCFVMGPSATADIGAYLVRGAQGARSLTVFFLKQQI